VLFAVVGLAEMLLAVAEFGELIAGGFAAGGVTNEDSDEWRVHVILP
jgi:hypothetical protein